MCGTSSNWRSYACIREGVSSNDIPDGHIIPAQASLKVLVLKLLEVILIMPNSGISFSDKDGRNTLRY